VSERGAPSLRELTVALTSTAGSGDVTVPLEPFDRSPDGVEMWERIFKTAALGLGFTPSAPHLNLVDIADEFARWIPGAGLHGRHVEVEVTHHNSTKLKDDGTPFVNHRAKFRGLVGAAPAPAAAAVPSFAGAGVGGDDPWS
jgi:hypothetical protein